MIALYYSKDQLKNFVSSLGQIMSMIKAKTDRIFVPLVIQNSPINPSNDMIIIMHYLQKN